MINTAKPSSPSLTNTSKVSHEETWNSNTTTWNTEVRTWDQTGSKMSNTSKVSSSMTNTPKP